jgi:hypothetical protein
MITVNRRGFPKTSVLGKPHISPFFSGKSQFFGDEKTPEKCGVGWQWKNRGGPSGGAAVFPAASSLLRFSAKSYKYSQK